jgi:hypothetical protein
VGRGAVDPRGRFIIAYGQAISSRGDYNVPHLLMKRVGETQ